MNGLTLRHNFSLYLGMLMVVLSFGLYAFYPEIALSRLSKLGKGEMVVGLSAFGWAMFLGGSMLVGKRGMIHLKRRYATLEHLLNKLPFVGKWL